ncbi:hypothetical protein BH11PLA2_BH11PLA2_45860 [soil metagenome]
MNTLTLTAGVDLKASADATAPPKFSMLAYTGDAMKVGFGSAVVVDLTGLNVLKARQPVLRDHDPSKIIGHVTAAAMDKTTGLTVEGVVSGTGPDAAEVISAARNGFPWQASIGAEIHNTEFLQAGSKATVNGRLFTGPLNIIRASTLKELSFVPMGADGATSATIRASFSRGIAAKDSAMDLNFNEWLADTGVDTATLNDDGRVKLEAAYESQSKVKTLEAAVKLADLRASRPSPQTNRGTVNEPAQGDIITASLLHSSGISHKVLADTYDQRVVDAATARGERGLGIQGLFRRVLTAAGEVAPSGKFNDQSILRTFEVSRQLQASGFSTISLPLILANTANKILLDSFMATSTTYNRFCRIGTNVDFKESGRYRLTAKGAFEKVAPDGEIKHVGFVESGVTSQLDTYGAMLGLSRQMIINDDLGAFIAAPKSLGRMSAIAVEKAVYTLLLANTGSFFATGNANNLTGAGSVLAAAGLAAAYKKFKEQTDANGDPTLIEPSVLLVPGALDITARQLMRDVQVVATTTANTPLPSGNPWANLAEVVAAPYLGSSFGLTGASDVQWFLTTGPGDFAIMEVSFLDGKSEPTVDTAEMDFNKLGVQMRAYLDFGVNFLEPRGGVRNVGA